jgi:hypothetical protein
MNTRDVIIRKLLAGAYICQVHGRRVLYEGNQRPIRKVTGGLYRYIQVVLKKHRTKERQVISLRAVQQLHGKHSIKKTYKALRNEAAHHQLGGPSEGVKEIGSGGTCQNQPAGPIKPSAKGQSLEGGNDNDGPRTHHQLQLFGTVQ